jgi:L-cysteate sulfo-lyase
VIIPVSLGTWPTPMEAAPRLARAIGLEPDDLWIKRDDLTGLAGGGNKVRKLEWTVAAALAEGADTLVTLGAPQSNHARLTAAAGARLGLTVHLVLAGRQTVAPSGNLILDSLLGAHIHWAGAGHAGTVAEKLVDTLRGRGLRPHLVPFGGSNKLSARGYHAAGLEILRQVAHVRTVVTAVGSGGTMAGLVSALGSARVLGIDVGAVSDARTAVASLLPDGGERAAASLRVSEAQIGAGYDTYTDSTRRAVELAARCEGVVLDPIYTGRAMAGLIAAVADGTITAGTQTVFLHTGGLPGLFGHPGFAR